MFSFNTDEETKLLPGGATVCAEFAGFPYVCVGFSGDPSFLPHPKGMHVR